MVEFICKTVFHLSIYFQLLLNTAVGNSIVLYHADKGSRIWSNLQAVNKIQSRIYLELITKLEIAIHNQQMFSDDISA